jgi:hypothetical protein
MDLMCTPGVGQVSRIPEVDTNDTQGCQFNVKKNNHQKQINLNLG